MISLMSSDPVVELESWLAEAGTWRDIARGERLFAPGEAPAGIFWVRTGELQLVRHGPQGERAIVQRCTRGMFAEGALFSDGYHCEGLAAAESGVWTMPRAQFLTALADPARSRAYIAWLSHAVRALRGQCERLSLPRAEDRVLHALRESGGYDLTAGTLKIWAAALGITHEHLYRTLARLERSGRIRRDAGGVWLTGKVAAARQTDNV